MRRRALKKLVDHLGHGGITKVANAIGKDASYVSRMLYPEGKSGKKRIGEDTVDILTECFPGWLDADANIVKFPGPKKAAAEITIQRLDVAGAMGKGRLAPAGYVDVVDRISVNKDYLRTVASFSSPDNLAIMTALGDSMKGTFNDGDLLLVDRGVNVIDLDAVYVVLYQDELYIKRFQRRPGKPLLMISDNKKKYEPVEIQKPEANGFAVLARVLIAWNAVRL